MDQRQQQTPPSAAAGLQTLVARDQRSVIQQTCAALFYPGQVVELRVLAINQRDGFNASGWFDNIDDLINAALRYDANQATGIYVTLNEIHPGCLARSNNRIKERTRTTTSDRDVIARHWLPIDIDPVRPSGVSSTQEEFEKARTVAKTIKDWLESEMGFSPGVRAASGNGIHLLYRIQTGNDDTAKQLITDCLTVLSKKFDSDDVHVDTTMHNAARIGRLYGTTARKGTSTSERPHRQSTIWKTGGATPIFTGLGICPLPLVETLATFGRRRPARRRDTPPKLKASSTEPIHYFDLNAFIDRHKIRVQRVEPFDTTGVRYVLEHCLFDSGHTGTSAAIGRTPNGAIFYKCQHDTCTKRSWKQVRAFFESERRMKSSGIAATDDANPWILAKIYIEEEYTDSATGQVTLRRQGQTFYAYREKKRCYVTVSDNDVKMSVTRWLGERLEQLTTRRVSDVFSSLCARVTVTSEIEIPFMSRVDMETGCTVGDPARHNWMTLQNGILDLDAVLAEKSHDECLLPLTSEWLSTIALPFPFPVTEEEEKCSTWLQFLEDIMEGDRLRINLIQEAFGYCFVQSTFLEKFIVMQGVGRNGKSTLLNVLRHLLGEDSVESLTPRQFGDRYLVHRLAQKLANLCPDMSEVDRAEEGVLKAVVSGDPITVDRKYKDSVQFKPHAVLFFATNVLPRFSDTSLGIWRRMILIPFNHIVPLDKVDVYLFAKFQKEMPAILLWSIYGMIRLCRNKRFTGSDVCAHAVRDYRMQCFPILTFLEECTEQHGETSTKQLWMLYRQWCRACGLVKPKPMHTFVRDVIMFQRQIQHTRPPGGTEANVTLYGISLKPNIDLDLLADGTKPPEGYGWDS